MKIMLCCNAGMSTSLLVQKMQKEAASRGMDATIEARPMNEAMDHINEADISPRSAMPRATSRRPSTAASPSPSSRWSTTAA